MMDMEVDAELRNWKGQVVQTEFFKSTNLSLFEIGLGVKTYAKQLCEVLTGRLRSSISLQMVNRESGFNNPSTPFTVETDRIGRPGDQMEARIGTAVPYAEKMEYLKPYLRTALGLVRGDAYRVVEKNGRMALEKI